MLSRIEILLGKEKLDIIKNSSILIIGVGGVGGYSLEMLARCGVGKFILVDGDIVDKSNLNRQIVSLVDNIGLPKVEVAKNRIKLINPNAEVVTIFGRYNEQSSKDILCDVDYVIDAIDSVKDKVHLIAECHRKGIKIISAMGAGGRIRLCDYKIADINQTEYDGLAKTVRHKLRELEIYKHTVCFSPTSTIKSDGVIGSVVFNPAMCGIKIADFVFGELVK